MSSNEEITSEMSSNEEITSEMSSNEEITSEMNSNEEMTPKPDKKEKMTTHQRNDKMVELLIALGLPLSLIVSLFALGKDLVKEISQLLFNILFGILAVILLVYFTLLAYFMRWKLQSNHEERIKDAQIEKDEKDNRQDAIMFRQETRNRRKKDRKGRKNVFSLAKSLNTKGFKLNESQMQEFRSYHNDLNDISQERQKDKTAQEKKDIERNQKLDALYEIVKHQNDTIQKFIDKEESKKDQSPKISKSLRKTRPLSSLSL